MSCITRMCGSGTSMSRGAASCSSSQLCEGFHAKICLNSLWKYCSPPPAHVGSCRQLGSMLNHGIIWQKIVSTFECQWRRRFLNKWSFQFIVWPSLPPTLSHGASSMHLHSQHPWKLWESMQSLENLRTWLGFSMILVVHSGLFVVGQRAKTCHFRTVRTGLLFYGPKRLKFPTLWPDPIRDAINYVFAGF